MTLRKPDCAAPIVLTTPLPRSRSSRGEMDRSLCLVLLQVAYLISDATAVCPANAGCFSPVGDLDRFRNFSASSTCGDPPSIFCVFQDNEPCSECSSGDPALSHDVRFINDGDGTTWWQSETGATNATITIDFEAPVLFEATVLTFRSPRPQSMVLERSGDYGQTWLPYRFYSASCRETFNVEEYNRFLQGMPPNSTEAICLAEDAQIMPGDGGEISFSISDQVAPGILDPQQMVDYQTMTNLRVRLVNPFMNLGVNESYIYYAIYEWSIQGTCLCNGHGECAPLLGEELADGKIYAGCGCTGSTGGAHCEVCLPLYNNAPWMPGNLTHANPCEMCSCNLQANSCTHDEALGQGVCSCERNTAGIACETCAEGFFQDQTLLLTDPNVCRSCGCNTDGTVGGVGNCNTVSGQCVCKGNVDSDASRLCAVCKEGFFNLTNSNPQGCQACVCDVRGSTACNATTGACSCKVNVEQPACSTCKDGFYGLTVSNPNGCFACDCNSAGSISPVCNKTSGQCPCLDNVVGLLCDTPQSGYHVRPLDAIKMEAEEAALINASTIYPLPGIGPQHTGRGFAQLPGNQGLAQLSLMVDISSQFELVLRYHHSLNSSASLLLSISSQAAVPIMLNCTPTAGPPALSSEVYLVSLLPSPNADTASFHTVSNLCLNSSTQYTVTLTNTGSGDVLVDSLVLIPAFSQISSIYASSSEVVRNLLELCIPREVVAVAEPCTDVTFLLSVEFYRQVFACDCDPTGVVAGLPCNPFSGTCPCKAGVAGERCDRCLNGQYNLTQDGCRDCGCHSNGSVSPVCDQTTGQCQCKPGVMGRACDQCMTGFYGLSQQGCTACGCSQFALSEDCDQNGQCSCPAAVGGAVCDQCDVGHFNLSASGCSPCLCDLSGSLSEQCDATSGQCPCIGGAVGQDCSECPDGHYRTNGVYTDVCEPCRCSGKTSQCTVDASSYVVVRNTEDFTMICALRPNCTEGWLLYDPVLMQTFPLLGLGTDGLAFFLDSNTFRLYAPGRYLGNQMLSYGLNFTIRVLLLDGAVPAAQFPMYLTGGPLGLTLVGSATVADSQTSPGPVADETLLTLTIRLREVNFRVGSLAGRPATHTDLLWVLLNVTEWSVSTAFAADTDFLAGHLELVELQVAEQAGPEDVNAVFFPVEVCECPVNYTGQFCQDCAPLYARPGGNLADSCTLCECYAPVDGCDASTGICLNCMSNTTGNQCESCLPGLFGDPMQGISCQPCPCPLVERSFSPSCFLDNDSLPTCNACGEGYTGRNCEQCVNGYFGDPLVGMCNPCTCNGNVDPSLGPVCDTNTGSCLNCINNTTGPTCGECLNGFYGDPFNGGCRPCECHSNGTLTCDSINGRCFCRVNVEGEQCNRCKVPFWGLHLGLPEGCIACDCCDRTASVGCNQLTGRCDCLPNVGSETDDKCCNCTPGFFGFSQVEGCQACGCSVGSASEECDQVTGACQCLDGAIGDKCDGCGPEYEGRVPNCRRCPQCYFDFNATLYQLLSRVEAEAMRVAQFSGIYGNLTMATVEAALASLHTELNSIAVTLAGLQVTPSQLDTLNSTVIQITSSLTSLSLQINTTTATLNQLETTLNNTFGYSTSFMGMDAYSLLTRAQNLNATATANINRAVTALSELRSLHTTATQAWQDAGQARSAAMDAILLLGEAVNDSTLTQSTLVAFSAIYEDNRMNLSYADVVLTTTANEIENSIAALLAENVTLEAIYPMVLNLSDVYLTRYEMVLNSEVAAAELEQAVQQALSASRMAWEVAQELLADTQQAMTSLNNSLDSTTNLLRRLDPAYQTARQANTTSSEIVQLPLPSTQDAQSLAQRINSSTVSQEQVSAILFSAESNRNKSQDLLTLAQNASNFAGDALATATVLQDHLADAVDSQGAANRSVAASNLLVAALERDASQTLVAAVRVNTENVTAQSDRGLAQDLGNRTEQLAASLRAQSQQLAARASQLCAGSRQAQQTISAAGEVAQGAHSTAEANLLSAKQDQVYAHSLEGRANILNAEANSVALKRIQDLLQQYRTEKQTQSLLLLRMGQLQEDMQTLEDHFTTAASTLARCYRTP